MLKKRMSWKKDKRAEIGIGTMIVFIAMVLVSAVAASVLISTANQVQEQALSTGDQAIDNVASGFVVQDVVGQVNKTDYTTIDNITVYIRLHAGSPEVNIDNVMISMISDTINQFMGFNATTTDATHYTASKQIDISQKPWDTFHVVGQGDLIKITITDADNSLGIGFNQEGSIKIIPAYGQSSLIEFTTGESFSTEWVTLV